MITRRSLADTIDAYDEQIADLNKSKRETFDAYRDQMVAARLTKPEIKAEIEAVKAAIKRRRESVKDEHALIEKDELIDEVFHEITRAPRATRENIEKFDAETGEIFDGEANAKLIATVATGMQTEIGRKALIAGIDMMIAAEEAEERRSDAALNILTKHEDIRTAPVTAEESPRKAAEAVSERTAPQVDADASAEAGVSGQPEMIPATSAESAGEVAGSASDLPTNSEKATVATQGEATAPTSDERVSLPVDDRSDAAANAGGTDVARSALRAGLADPTSNTGEGAANTALPAKSKLRPNCQRPGETCGGYGDKHCHDCLRSMREYEAA